MRRILCFFIGFILIFTVFTSCTPNGGDMFRREFYSMDTVIVVKIPKDTGISENEAEEALDFAEAVFEDIAERVSRYCETDTQKSKSEIWRINENAGVMPVHVSDEVFYLIKTALYYGEITDGKFNIAMGALSDLWGFSTDEYRVPGETEISEALALCNLSDVVLNEEDKTVYLKTQGMKLDLGALSKGYATEALANALKEKGITSAIIDAGGNVGALGEKNDSSDWTVGVQNPRDSSDIIGKVFVNDEYVVSSGDYQRCFEEDDVRYCHIFDPDSGYPVSHTAASCVISESGILADILSTVAFTLGEDGMRKFIAEHDEFSDLAWLLVYENDDNSLCVVTSSAMEECFSRE